MSLKPAVDQNDHVQGTKTATLEIVEYGDYQCPYCGAAHPILKEMMEEFGHQIKFVFRNFPLSEIHQFARPAAVTAEAAATENKFWEVHDALFEQQSQLSTNFLLQLAENFKVDIAQLKENETLQNKVDSDFESGMRSGVNGTPTFFINGVKFDGGAVDLYALLKSESH